MRFFFILDGLDPYSRTSVSLFVPALPRFLLDQAVEGIEPTNGFNAKSLYHRGYQIECWEVGGIFPFWGSCPPPALPIPTFLGVLCVGIPLQIAKFTLPRCG